MKLVDITFWMAKDPPTISAEGTVFEAVTVMKEKNSDAILIVNEGEPIGIFTERDYNWRCRCVRKSIAR